ncbi:MAG: hypothetical protein LBR27_10440 [Bifidobacteriaceae bacterium]|jgi:hypothetical protein|nr:hypothetical protein [Bifidobacteriaceae bacterium]
MQAVKLVKRWCAWLFAVAVLLPAAALGLISSSPSQGLVPCELQAKVDALGSAGGVVTIARACTDLDQVVVSAPVVLVGAAVEAQGGIEVGDGGQLTLTDGIRLDGLLVVDAGGQLTVVGSDVIQTGGIVVDPGGTAKVQGSGSGVTVGPITNQGYVFLQGKVTVGSAAGGISGGASQDPLVYVEVWQLDAAASVWIDAPPAGTAAPYDVVLVPVNGIGVDPAAVFHPTSDAWVVGTRTLNSQASLVVLNPAVQASPSPSPSPSPSSTPTVPQDTEFDLVTAIDAAAAGATIRVPDGYVVRQTVVVQGRDGTVRDVNLTGGTIVKATTGAMFKVPAGSRLGLRAVVLDGAGGGTAQNPVATHGGAYGPLVEVEGAKNSKADGLLAIGAGAVLRNNASHGVVNNGVVWMDGAGAAISGNVVDTAYANRADGPAGGAGVWNRATGTLWLISGSVSGNKVIGTDQVYGYGGGVLNEGLARLVGAAVTGNSASYAGGGIAVARQAGATAGGRLEIGTYQTDPFNSGPVISGNTAPHGGGVAVIDAAEWGRQGTPESTWTPTSSAPYVEIYFGSLQANTAWEGGAVWVAGGAAVRFTGQVTVAGSNAAEVAGTSGVAVQDGYAGLGGQYLAEAGAGIALQEEGWPLWVESGFNQPANEAVVIETVPGLADEGDKVPVIQVARGAAALSQEKLTSFELAVEGAELTADGVAKPRVVYATIPGSVQPVTNQTVSPTPSPTPTVLEPVETKTPSPSAVVTTTVPVVQDTPTASPEVTSTPTATRTLVLPMTDDYTYTSTATASASASPSASATPSKTPTPEEPTPEPSVEEPSPSPSTSLAPTPSSKQPPASESPAVEALEPPPAASMKALGFSLISLGTLGLVGLASYVLLRRTTA